MQFIINSSFRVHYCFILALKVLLFISCKNANNYSSNSLQDNSLQEENQVGIIYFSTDNGNTWGNASKGIPQEVNIGLGGIATTNHLLGVATKQYGIFIYNSSHSVWEKIPTEQQIIDANIGSMKFYKNNIYVGTQLKGIFYSNDKGKTWLSCNNKLSNLTIRRFFENKNKLYVCTNEGFYSLNEQTNDWDLEYKENSLQVNGATVFQENVYIATNKGVFKKNNTTNWENVLPNHSVHNISASNNQIFAMTYNELLLSSSDGLVWQSAQNGLPKTLYTFNILTANNVLFAAQWDGVYSKTSMVSSWVKSSYGLPENFAVTNLLNFKDTLVITTSERKIKGE